MFSDHKKNKLEMNNKIRRMCPSMGIFTNTTLTIP